MRSVRKKIRSRRGVTLTELLAAVLVLGLVSLGAAVGVNSALRVYRQSTALSDAQTLSSTLSVALMDELRFARDLTETDGVVTFTSDSFGSGVSIETDAQGHLTVGGQTLVGSGAYAGLRAEAAVHLEHGAACVTLHIQNARSETLTTAAFSVLPLNSE